MSQESSIWDPYSRPMGDTELLFTKLTGRLRPPNSPNREHLAISLALKLKFPPSFDDPTEYIYQAWDHVLRRHKALNSILIPPNTSDSGGQIRISLRDQWNTSRNDTFTRCDDKDASSLFSRLQSSPTAACYWLPASGEVVLRSSHWRIDAIGMAKLGDEYLELLVKLLKIRTEKAFMAENGRWPPIGPSLEMLVQRKNQTPPDQGEEPRLGEAADALVSEFKNGSGSSPSIGFPTREDSHKILPSNSSRVETRIDASATAQVVAACRAKGIKVTSAIHSAVVCAAARFPRHPLCKSYTAFRPVNLRQALASTITPKRQCDVRVVGVYLLAIPLSIENVFDFGGKHVKDFETIAQELNKIYSKDIHHFWEPEDHSRPINLLDLAGPYAQRIAAQLNTPELESLPAVYTPDLYSFGKLETYIQNEYIDEDTNLEVVKCWISTEILTQNIQFQMWSWKDELTLGASFNTSFYEDSFMTGVLGKVIEELLLGCGIEAS
ncbi:uncharacterized protein F4822DRAFT_357564 [Hypoxylon trugodes]|uniref:uncharacterized protein n=1 Tax=Hypoxylon trugodes TaxID=326681 RepID=UPI0021A20D8A|nr:uncharacterized protein F4822DRAFT_357564 [Hypoxylon trugodes]KAI1385912.1 hypothetical protein F4822DRAFT_357564 [Hypoxylon trugodes]